MSDPFIVGGVTYRAGKLDAVRQFHVVRRLTPILGCLQGADMKGLMDGDPEVLAGLLGPVSDAVAGMPDADVDYVLAACLGACQREEASGLGWSAVWNKAAGRPQYDDLTMPDMLQLVGRVVAANLAGFTSGTRPTSPAGPVAFPMPPG